MWGPRGGRGAAAALWIALVLLPSINAATPEHGDGIEDVSDILHAMREAANNPRFSETHSVGSYEHSFDANLLNRGMAYVGANLRLRRAIEKLQRGEETSIGVIGGGVACAAIDVAPPLPSLSEMMLEAHAAASPRPGLAWCMQVQYRGASTCRGG